MVVSITQEGPLQDNVRALVTELNEALLSLTRVILDHPDSGYLVTYEKLLMPLFEGAAT